ncbi:MAG: hydrogenase/urease maturation nickel metallochaperone HypA [Myxococcota bacterium]
MHESKVAEYVYEIVEETVKEDPELQNRKITQLVFKLSKPYTVYPDSFCFYFEELIKGTFLEGTTLEFEEFGEDESQKGFYLASIEVEDPE